VYQIYSTLSLVSVTDVRVVLAQHDQASALSSSFLHVETDRVGSRNCGSCAVPQSRECS
jgi:hypothetical protein